MSRRLAREVVFRALFQVDIGKCRPKQALVRALEGFTFDIDEEQFIEELVIGTIDSQPLLDQLIKKHLVKWDLERLSAVDRNLLRIALFEILYRPDIPFAVSINEALELAKKYGSTGEAVGFINGVLDRAVGETLGKES
ncbi:MAG: transcription antitermination factor NusB [Bacillota bacterium]|nr:transcription antitermination factor NusB [Bacillota bacterium]